MTTDEKFMRRCIELARNGTQTAPPNPTVGAVIVCDGKIIGEGYHVHCGQGHAEVNAIASVRDESLLARSTMYVSLEPCSHYGKTPPCADLIIRKGIRRVVVGCIDPFSLVSGRGVQKLRDAGIDVTVGVLEKECRDLIRRFIVFNTQQRPYVTLKWAESADGYMDICRNGGSPVILSSPVSSTHVHKLRAENKAILVGTNTARLDNPSLTVRNWYGDNPVRLVIDRRLELPKSLHLLDGSVLTYVLTQEEMPDRENVRYVRLDFSKDIVPQILGFLYENKLQTLMVEGGSKTLQSFINSGLWDEAYVEHAEMCLGDGIASPQLAAGLERTFLKRGGAVISHYRRRTGDHKGSPYRKQHISEI